MFYFQNMKYKTRIIFLVVGILLGIMLSQGYSGVVGMIGAGYDAVYKYVNPVGYNYSQTRELEVQLTKGEEISVEKILDQFGKNRSLFFKQQEIDEKLFEQTKSLLDQAIHEKKGRDLCLLYSGRFDLHKQHYNSTVKNSSTKQKEYLNHFLLQINFLTERIQKDCSGDARLKAKVIVFLDDISKVDVLSPDFQNDFLKEVSKAMEKEKEHFGKTPIVEELQKAKEIVESDYSS